jgi:hypothetical protein
MQGVVVVKRSRLLLLTVSLAMPLVAGKFAGTGQFGLECGKSLMSPGYLESRNGGWQLVVETNGSLVLYKIGKNQKREPTGWKTPAFPLAKDCSYESSTLHARETGIDVGTQWSYDDDGVVERKAAKGFAKTCPGSMRGKSLIVTDDGVIMYGGCKIGEAP